MKVKTLLNKLRLNEYQTIRVLDYKSEYFIESTSKKEIIAECGRSSILDFKYSKFGDCFVIRIYNLKMN